MKTMFLLSHTPIPRFIKRINVASENNVTKVVYWDRGIEGDFQFTLPNNVECERIKIKAPQGKPVKRSLLLIKFAFKSLIKLKKFNPRNLHVGNIDMLLIAYIYKLILSGNTKIIYEIGDLPEITFKSNLIGRLYEKIEMVLLKKVNYLILTSPYFWNNYYRNITEKNKYYLIPNVPPKKIINFTNQYRGLNENLTIGYIGSVRYEEQLKMLIDCLKNKKNINLLVAGTGKNVESLKEYSMNNNNIVFSGEYDYKEIGDLYNKVDVVYSVYDTRKNNVKIAMPNRLYEAILFEKPLIVSKNTELAKFVLNKDVGYVVSDNRLSELEELIVYISENSQELQKKKDNCSAIKNKYTFEEYKPIIKSLYQ